MYSPLGESRDFSSLFFKKRKCLEEEARSDGRPSAAMSSSWGRGQSRISMIMYRETSLWLISSDTDDVGLHLSQLENPKISILA